MGEPEKEPEDRGVRPDEAWTGAWSQVSRWDRGELISGRDKVKAKDGGVSRVVLLEGRLCPEPAGNKFEKLGQRKVETIEAAPWRSLIGNRNAVAAGGGLAVKFCGFYCVV